MKRNRKIGRNELCPCGSEKKYKHCHGGINAHKLPSLAPVLMNRGFNQELARFKAQQKIREQQQGLGKPIISEVFKGNRIVVVGNTIHYSKDGKTFHDFLFYYIKKAIGEDWVNTELKKPYEDRHPILQWYHQVCIHQKKTIPSPGEIVSEPLIGVVEAYLQLAYNLYLLAHNEELQKVLINRLKHPDQFPGAYYETFVFANLIKSGFNIEFEDESDRSRKHCECVAICKESGAKYSVEAKLINRSGALGAKKNTTSESSLKSSLGRKLRDALKKDSEHQRIIFIDINLPKDANNQIPSWIDEAVSIVKEKEHTLSTSDSAYVILTNHPHHYHPQDLDYKRAAVAIGFNIPDFDHVVQFKSFREAYYAKKKHINIDRLMASMRIHYEIPSTFDGEIPELKFSKCKQPRLLIGHEYLISDGNGREVVGKLTAATVLEKEKKISGAYYIQEEGRSVISTCPISDNELIAYKKYPDTFFGVIHPQMGKIDDGDYFGFFEWVLNSYKNTSKEKLLELMKDFKDFVELQKLSQEELAVTYSERIAYACIKPKIKK